jgi:hypothetical protein
MKQINTVFLVIAVLLGANHIFSQDKDLPFCIKNANGIVVGSFRDCLDNCSQYQPTKIPSVDGLNCICAGNSEFINNLQTGENMCNYFTQWACEGNALVPFNAGPWGWINIPLQNNLKVWYPFDEYLSECPAAEQIVNYVPNTSLMKYNNITPACGYVYYSARFNNGSSYFGNTENNLQSIDFPAYQSFSIVLWINFQEFNSSVITILDKRRKTICGKYIGYSFFYDSKNQKIGIQLASDEAPNEGYKNYISTVKVLKSEMQNKWRLLAVTVRRGSQNRKIRFYMDNPSNNTMQQIGNNIDCSNMSGKRLADPLNSAVLLVGKSFDNNRCFIGQMDELLIYNTQLQQIDIQTIYNAGHFGIKKPSGYNGNICG